MTDPVDHPLVDAHLHLWNPARIRMSWIDAVPALEGVFEVPDLLQSLGPLASRLAAAVLVESAVDDEALDDELEWIAACLESPGPVRAAVAGWRPFEGADSVDRRLDVVSGLPGVVGLRHVLHPPDRTATDVLDEAHVRAVRRAGERGLLIELCMRPDQLEAAVELVDLAPDTIFVIDHLGRPRTAGTPEIGWREAMGRLAERPRISTKLSALIECAEGSAWDAERFRPFFDAALAAFGSDRILWGSNWPVCFTDSTPGDWIAAADRLTAGLSESDRAAIAGGNARRIYRIS